KMIQDPQFGEIVDFEKVREVLTDEVYDRLSPDFNMMGAIQAGSNALGKNPSYIIAAGASMLAWMMLLAADEQELAEELKGKIFTLGWTEEPIGSDLLGMRTQATPKSDDPDEREFHVKGSKWMINNSYHADYHMVLAKEDPESDGPRSMSLFLVPRSSTKNWERLETHVLRNMVLTKFEIDGPGRLIGKKGRGLVIVQRMAAAARYQCAYAGVDMVRNSVRAALDHLSSKNIFKEYPINFSNVFRQMYNIALNGAFYNFLFNRAVVFSDSSFLAFHGTMLKSWLLLRTNELLSQNWLVTGSKGFTRESIIGRDTIDSFVLPVFDGHYTINTLMTAKYMNKYLDAGGSADVTERTNAMRENLFLYQAGGQLDIPSRQTRNPDFFNYADYWKQLNPAVDIDVDAMLQRVRDLMAELDETDLSSDLEYKYKTGVLVHWLEAVLASAEFVQVMGEDIYINAIIQTYNGFVTEFNKTISEGGLQTEFLTPLRQQPLPEVENNVKFLRDLLNVEEKIAQMRMAVAGD
ncbi:MAG: acyl-CoA dehydrogenase family protein, partial [Chloroflexota bacterium]